LSLCAAGKDFGKGFYVTTDYSQACRSIRTAIGKALKNHVENVDSGTGYVSVYEYKTESVSERKRPSKICISRATGL